MKKFLYCICFFVFFNCNKSKDTSPLIEPNNVDNVNGHLNLGSYNYEKIKALKVSENNKLNRELIYNSLKDFYNNGNEKEFLLLVDLLLRKSTVSKDSLLLAQTLRYKANNFKDKHLNDSAFIYYIKSEKLFKLIKDQYNIPFVLINKSIVQFNVGDFVGSNKTLNEAYDYSVKNKNEEIIYAIFTMMGLVSLEAKEYELSINYFEKAIEVVKKNNLAGSFQLETCQNNIGLALQRQGNFIESIDYFNNGLKNQTIKRNDPELYSLLIDNLSYSNLKLGNLDNVESLFFQSLMIRKKLNNPTLIIFSNAHIAEYYYTIKEEKNAILHINTAINTAKKNHLYRDYIVALKQASVIDKLNSQKYANEYISLSDSIRDVEKKTQDRFARIQLETDEIIQEKDSLADRNRNLMYFLMSSIGIFSFLYYLRNQRAKNRELKHKEAQQRANEEIFNLMMSQQAIIDESRTKEKQKLAQELHDSILGRMFGIRLSLDSANQKSDDDARVRRFEIIEQLKNIEQDIREISHDLNREKQVLINNFVSIVANLIDEQKSNHEASVSFFMDNTIQWDKVSSVTKINLYRILQECLQNINKYANAKTINVGYVKNNDTLIFKINDDGIGFDSNKKSKGIGTKNMIARTNECNGLIDLQSAVGDGTTVTITIPLVIENKPNI